MMWIPPKSSEEVRTALIKPCRESPQRRAMAYSTSPRNGISSIKPVVKAPVLMEPPDPVAAQAIREMGNPLRCPIESVQPPCSPASVAIQSLPSRCSRIE